MKLVVENSDKDIERQHAGWAYQSALAAITANLLRITRGAGKAYELVPQATKLLVAMKRFRDAAGHWPDAFEAQQALSLRSDRAERMSDAAAHMHYADETVVRGALQLAASRLLGQSTQETRGHHEMYDGINRVHELREEERKKRAAEWAASRPKPKPRAKAKPRAKPKTAD